MSSTCLYGKVDLVNKPLTCKVDLVCGYGINYYPLYVDEGLLLVDFNGSITKLFVKR